MNHTDSLVLTLGEFETLLYYLEQDQMNYDVLGWESFPTCNHRGINQILERAVSNV